VTVERDDATGRVVREAPAPLLTVYSAAQAAEAVVEFEAQIAALVNNDQEVAVPVNEKTTTVIACDNGACPGNVMPKNDREGWLFVNAEVYGQPTAQLVFCSAACLSAASGTQAVELGLAPAEPST